MDGIWQTTDRSIDILQLKHTQNPFGNLILINISGLSWNELQGFTPLRLSHIAGYGFAGIVLEGRLV